MSGTKKTALVICPGRGVYNASELGYLNRHYGDKRQLLERFDEQRRALGQTPILDLDGAERFSVSKYSRGDNASGLIYACSYADFLSIDQDALEVVAVTGNSMGWYTALACAGALSAEDGFRTVNTMGTIMQEQLIGGQLIYPIVDEQWQVMPGVEEAILALVEKTEDLFVSIRLGGMIVLAGTKDALDTAEHSLKPAQGRFPMRLANHAAFHSPLLQPNSDAGRTSLPASLFKQPDLPLIDGRGSVWMPDATDLDSLWDYTLAEQVTHTYDFTRAVQTGLKEFAPHHIIVLGPGNTLGGATAQAMIAMNWLQMGDKSDFSKRQETSAFMLAMGHDQQRPLITASTPT